MPTDPVCGMFVEAGPEALQLTRESRTYYFCSQTCARTFAEPEQARSRLLRRLAVAWPLSVAIVVLTYVVSFPQATVLAAVLAAAVQFYPGWVFYRGTYDAVRNRIANMDVLIAVGTSAAFFYSLAIVMLSGRLRRPPISSVGADHHADPDRELHRAPHPGPGGFRLAPAGRAPS